MSDIKRVQAKDANALRKALAAKEEFVLFEGDEPLARVVPVAQDVAKRAGYFTHYPHPETECLWTCWRHKRNQTAVAEQQEPALAQ